MVLDDRNLKVSQSIESGVGTTGDIPTARLVDARATAIFGAHTSVWRAVTRDEARNRLLKLCAYSPHTKQTLARTNESACSLECWW